MEELKKIHELDVQDTRLVPFNTPSTYAMGGGTPHGR
jgi:hypothetical protein